RSYLRTSIYTFNLTTLGTGQVNLGDLSTRSPSSSTTSTAARATRLNARGTPISPSGSYEAFSFNTLLLCISSLINPQQSTNPLATDIVPMPDVPSSLFFPALAIGIVMMLDFFHQHRIVWRSQSTSHAAVSRVRRTRMFVE